MMQMRVAVYVVFFLNCCAWSWESEPLAQEIAELLYSASSGVDFDFGNAREFSEEFSTGQVLANPSVDTTSGEFTGSSTEQVHAFYSVPYAKPPVGNLRFKPPEAAEHGGSMNVSVPNYVQCSQSPQQCSDGSCGTTKTEDCLVLNIYAPASVALDSGNAMNELLPVMFWIHGGAFFVGSGTNPGYDGGWLSNKTNAVVVNINYRLDALGFLVFEEGGDKFDGNQGLKDQQLALKWVRDNIAKFGGDKDKVTIFGNSAGAQSVMLHLLSQESDPLFHRAIMQSNPAVFYYYTTAEAKVVTEELLDVLNCTTNKLDCLMNTEAHTLVNARARVMVKAGIRRNIFDVVEPYRPVTDGVEFIGQPLDQFQSGNWQKNKAFIIGSNTEELEFINVVFRNRTVAKPIFERVNSFVLGDYYGPIVSERYMQLAGNRPGPQYDYTAILAQEIGDMFFVCPSRALARLASRSSPASDTVYLYSNNHPADLGACTSEASTCGHAYHGSEPRYVFNTVPNATADDMTVSDIFSEYWGSFAYTGSPQSDKYTAWPAYVPQSEAIEGMSQWINILLKAPNSETETGYNEDLCDFWDELGFYVNITSPGEVTTLSTPVVSDVTEIDVTEVDVTEPAENEKTTVGSATIFGITFSFTEKLMIAVGYFLFMMLNL